MNSLVGYGSDDNSDDSGEERCPETPGRPTTNKNQRKPAVHGDNYEEVGMDMSEDSNGSEEPGSNSNHTPREANPFYNPEANKRSGSRSPKYNKKEEDNRSNKKEEERGSRDDRADRYRAPRRDDRSSRDEDRGGRGRREDDKGRSKYRDDRRDRKDDRFARDRRDSRRRSRSRDRRRSSRSPKRSSRSPRRPSRSPKRSSRSPVKSSRSPRRSRSGSNDRGDRKFTSRKEKADKRMDRLDKLGIQFKPDNYPKSALEDAERNSQPGANRFFMPGITGRFRDQIEKRKLLWHKGKESDNAAATAGPSVAPAPSPVAGGSKATKVYEATTFADDKTSNKFKRLMGIKETTDTSALPVKGTDVLKKQQEMFTSMEAQYEVARTATHTMRGVGLGFGSFQR